MANVQAPIPPGLMDTICCAILCCEEKEYNLKKKPPKKGKDGKMHDPTCTRLGHRKHSCVLHKLREKQGDKLTTKNKFKDEETGKVLEASPRYPPNTNPPDAIPDLKANFTKADKKDKKSQAMGMTDTGESMLTKKERTTYTDVDGGCQVYGMSPQDAKDTIKGDCKCEDA